jgi:hypothetical protein
VRTVVVILVMALGLAGCARDGDRTTVTSVADTFFAALGAGDGARACEQLSPGTRAELESQEQAACREAITTLDLEGGSVVRANVYVLNAMVELSNGEAAFLDQGEEGWRIDAAGCAPLAKPADRPFDCELKD